MKIGVFYTSFYSLQLILCCYSTAFRDKRWEPSLLHNLNLLRRGKNVEDRLDGVFKTVAVETDWPFNWYHKMDYSLCTESHSQNDDSWRSEVNEAGSLRAVHWLLHLQYVHHYCSIQYQNIYICYIFISHLNIKRLSYSYTTNYKNASKHKPILRISARSWLYLINRCKHIYF